ncbi:hypothetical protein AAY473_017375, partial [Plecturocebus cupreus]
MVLGEKHGSCVSSKSLLFSRGYVTALQRGLVLIFGCGFYLTICTSLHETATTMHDVEYDHGKTESFVMVFYHVRTKHLFFWALCLPPEEDSMDGAGPPKTTDMLCLEKKRKFVTIKLLPFVMSGNSLWLVEEERKTKTSHPEDGQEYVLGPALKLEYEEEYLGRQSLTASPGWSAGVRSQLTATADSLIQLILLPRPPEKAESPHCNRWYSQRLRNRLEDEALELDYGWPVCNEELHHCE